MSTTSLNIEERKLVIDSFLMQRRMLLGCTAFIGVAVIIWIVAISTDHWFIVTGGQGEFSVLVCSACDTSLFIQWMHLFSGIFVPDTRRYFLSSHSGIWKICRYGLTPYLLANSSAARNFTTLTYTNPKQADDLKKVLLEEKDSFINDFYQKDFDVENVTEINDPFLRQMFAVWIKNSTDEFKVLKNTYKSKVTERQDASVKIVKAPPTVLLNPTNVTAVKVSIGAALTNITYNNHPMNIIVPMELQAALFNKWEERQRVIYLLWFYARDLDISISLENVNGTKYVIRPPMPPKKGRIANGYQYTPFSKYNENNFPRHVSNLMPSFSFIERCKYHNLFPTEDDITQDPSIDNEILGKSFIAHFLHPFKYHRNLKSYGVGWQGGTV